MKEILLLFHVFTMFIQIDPFLILNVSKNAEVIKEVMEAVDKKYEPKLKDLNSEIRKNTDKDYLQDIEISNNKNTLTIILWIALGIFSAIAGLFITVGITWWKVSLTVRDTIREELHVYLQRINNGRNTKTNTINT